MNAAIDTNSKQTATARLKTDGITVTRLTADPNTGALDTTAVTTGATIPSRFAATDENHRTSWFAVSENDGITPIALQCDSTGALLVKHV